MSIVDQTLNQNLLPNSKKIKKLITLRPTISTKKETNGNESSVREKKYKTFQTNIKKTILFDIKKKVMELSKLPYDESELDSEELLKLVSKVDLAVYNKILTEVLEKHVSTFTPTQKNLTQWRKKIKGWLYTSEKPEYRGNPVVTSEKLKVFREEVIKILNELPYRSFSNLREKILKVLEKFHNASHVNSIKDPQPFNQNVCSKHWWFNFMQKNTDIKEKWEKIPLKRENAKHGLEQLGSQSTIASQTTSASQVMEEEKTSNLLVVDPVFSNQFLPSRPVGDSGMNAHIPVNDLMARQNAIENLYKEVFAYRLGRLGLPQLAILMKLNMMSSFNMPSFQGLIDNQSKNRIKTEVIDGKTESTVTKKEEGEGEGEAKVKIEEEHIKLTK